MALKTFNLFVVTVTSQKGLCDRQIAQEIIILTENVGVNSAALCDLIITLCLAVRFKAN